jgi:hypothetical protein
MAAFTAQGVDDIGKGMACHSSHRAVITMTAAD